MKLVVLQPGYLPWLGYFDQLEQSDLFVHYDDVQYDKHGWRNRNRIRTPGEDPGCAWITVPIRSAGRFGAKINEVEIQGERWRRKHWRSLEQYYGKTAHFGRYAEPFRAIYQDEWLHLVELNLALVEVIAAALGLETRTVRSSEVAAVPPGEDPSQRLLDLCRHFGASEYLSGSAARDYLDLPRFEEAGVRVTFQDYQHPSYAQRFPGFVSHLSIVDLLFNVGPESRSILRGDQRT